MRTIVTLPYFARCAVLDLLAVVNAGDSIATSKRCQPIMLGIALPGPSHETGAGIIAEASAGAAPASQGLLPRRPFIA